MNSIKTSKKKKVNIPKFNVNLSFHNNNNSLKTFFDIVHAKKAQEQLSFTEFSCFTDERGVGRNCRL